MYIVFYTGAIAVPTNWYTDITTYSILNGLNCIGNEPNILTCPLSNIPSFCHERNDANVICPSKVTLIIHSIL